MRGFTVHINDPQPEEEVRFGASHESCRVLPEFAGHERGPESEAVKSEDIHHSGHLVDRYRIVRLIAVGGTARVYEAVHEFTNKAVALKIMRGRLTSRPDVIERFRQEAVVLSSLRHENLVAVENAGLTSDARVFLAMELLRGKTLRDVLNQRGQLSPEEAIQIMLGVTSGVAAAHEGGVVHRDLKPENIFCVLHGPVKVLDLGTAKFGGDGAPSIRTALGRVVGTAAYMAPERFEGEPGDFRSDIYSLGLIAYECLAGFHPMVPDGKWPSTIELASRQATYEPKCIPGVAPGLWQIITRALQKSPKLRYQSVKAFRLALLGCNVSAAAARQSSKAKLILVPVIAGSLCGTMASGVAQWWRSSYVHVEHAPIRVDDHALDSSDSTPGLRRSEPHNPPGNPEPTLVPQPIKPVITKAEAPTINATTSSRSQHPAPTAPTERITRPVNANNGEASRAPSPSEDRSNPQRDYESARGSHASGDDLPASGL